MNDFLFSFVAGHNWHAFSMHWILTLAHFLWQGAAIGLLSALILALCRHSSSRIRHGICLTALICCLPCVVATWMLVDVDRYATSSSISEIAVVSETDLLGERHASPISMTEERELPDSRMPASTLVTSADNLSDSASKGSSSATETTLPSTAASMIDRAAPLLAIGYFLGVFILLFRTSLGLWGGRRLRTLSQQITDAQLLALIEQQARRIGLKTVPMVAYCSRVAVPTVIGLLKPIVLLPASLVTRLDTDQLAAILSHELAHIRRLDLFVNLLQRVIESLLFFHPVVWWLSRRISLERENCCDDLAAASGFGNLQYAGALLRMAELSLPERSKKFASQLMALSADGQNTLHFSRRIERLLEIPSAPRLAVSRTSAVFALVLSVVSVGVLAQIADIEQEPVDRNPIVDANEETDAGEEKTLDTETPAGSQFREKEAVSEEVAREKPTTPPKGLEFLKPYPKLYELSFEMTGVEFLSIAQREKLKIGTSEDGESYFIPTGDGHTVIVMFGNNGDKCSGIQRIRGELSGEAEVPKYIIDKNGIYWSSQVLDGYRVGAKLLVKAGLLTSGEPLVVQYVLKNEAEEARSVELNAGDSIFPSLVAVNRIRFDFVPQYRKPESQTLQPGQTLQIPAHQTKLDTTGFPPGSYQVDAGEFYWLLDPENPQRRIPLRSSKLELPLTILPPDGSDRTPGGIGFPANDGIDWGKAVAGLQVGSRLLGDTNLFVPGSTPQIQLFVRNITTEVIDIDVFLPHLHDGWLLNVEDSQGDYVPLDRNRIIDSIYTPEQSTRLTIQSGKTVPLTGVARDVNESAREIVHSSFQVVKERPKADDWNNKRLVSKGGDYRTIHTVVMKRSDMPGVRLNVDSGKSAFRVSGPELKAGKRDKNEQKPREQGEAPIRLWKARLVDGLTGKPLPGIIVRVLGAITSKSEPQAIELVSSGQGIITVPLRDGTVTSVDAQTLGWWSGPYQFIGQPPSNLNQPPQEDGEPVSDPKVPRDIKLWRGDTVTGKLLYPDKSPAEGVLLHVGVYINHMEWKKRLGMDLNFYSFDHGQWPNWSRAILTDDDGGFTTTVPPENARSWIRVGTTTLGFGSINPEQFESEGTVRALAACVPFEAEIGGNDPGYGYTIVEDRPSEGSLGTLQLHAGIRVRGRVVDAEGNGLEGVFLATASRRGPHAGRGTWSGEDGRFEFLPVEPGPLIIKPDARVRDVNRMVISRDVQAVFIEREYFVPSEAVELIVQAVPHVEVEFEWIDRRADQEATASYYGHFKGHFKVVGHYPLHDDQRAYWHGETKLIERDGRKFLVVKVPRKLIKPTLVLVQDRAVTASYEDEAGKKSGPGRLELGDITKPIRRTIYGDEPRQKE